MKRIIKFLVLGVIAVVFIGTFVFLYRKSQVGSRSSSRSTARQR